MTPIEIMARALFAHENKLVGGWTWEKETDHSPELKQYWFDSTAAAIKALREAGYVICPIEPTPAMSAASQWLITEGNLTVNYCVEANMNGRAIYRAMLQAYEGGE